MLDQLDFIYVWSVLGKTLESYDMHKHHILKI